MKILPHVLQDIVPFGTATQKGITKKFTASAMNVLVLPRKCLLLLFYFVTDSISDIMITLGRTITDDTSIPEKILSNIASMTNFFTRNKVILIPGEWTSLLSELVGRIVSEQNKQMPWQNLDE